MILQENFSDNKNEWEEKTDDVVSMSVQDSGYLFEHKKKGRHWRSGIHVDIPAGSPRRIHTTLEKMSGVDNNGYGLMWRYVQDENDETAETDTPPDFWTFEVSGDGHYRVSQWKQGQSKWHNHVRWTRSDLVQEGDDVNELAVVQDVDHTTFYLNGVEVETVEMPPVDQSITKQLVGFIVTDRIKIKAHHLTIDENDVAVPLTEHHSGKIINN